MPSVAEVQFKATGQQTVVSAFNSVGNAAGESATKVQQNSSAMKTMGQGMKSSVSGIASAAGAFATLSLSVVNTWRAYRDLTDAQIAVDKANLRVAKTTEAIRKSEKEVAALKKASAKGGLDSIAATNKLRLAEENLNKHRKDGKHTAAQLAVEEDNLNLLKRDGTGSSKKLEDAENKLALQKEQLGVQTDVAREAQERFNDTQQNFYLSILPTALSGFASLSAAFSGLKGMLTGGGGLVAGLGPIGLILTGISVAIIAFKTNFLGLRDAVGGVIKWLQDRFGAWKDTIQEVFGFIQKGDWSGAFNRIKEAAAAFWADLVKTVPFFGGVEVLAKQLSKGDWAGAFKTIRDAAVFFWVELKKAIPLFGTIKTVIKQISGGDWEGAFKTIGDSIMKGLAAIGGDKWVLKFQLMRDTAVRAMNDLNTELTKKGGAFDLINQGFAKLGSGDIVGGLSGIGAGIKTALDEISSTINAWVLLNFGVNLTSIETQANAIGTKILDGIKSGLTFVARTWIDPILVQLLDPATWINGFIAMGGFFVKIGTALYTAIGTALGNAAKDPKGTATWWGNIGNAIWTGLSDWFTTNLPGATKAMQAIAKSLQDGIEAAKRDFESVGIAMWNAMIEGIRTLTGGGMSPFGPALDALKKNPVELPFQPILTPESKSAIQTLIEKNPIQLATGLNIKPAYKDAGVFKNRVERQKYIANLELNTKNADIAARKEQAKINDMKATMNVGARFIGFGHGAGFGQFQHGTNTTVKRPTMFMAGEGGRPEDVYVKPRGSAGLGPGGGGTTIINVYVDGVLRPARYDMGARK